MAFDAAAAVLTDRNKFRNFFRTLPQYEFLPRAILRTTLEFKWTQMAVITQTENLFTSVRPFWVKFPCCLICVKYCRLLMNLQFCLNSVVGHWTQAST